MTEQEQQDEQRQQVREASARVALPLAVAAVVISLIVVGLLYLELSRQTEATRKVARDTAQLSRENRRLSNDLARVQRARIEVQEAGNRDQVDNCFQRNANGPALARLLAAVRSAVADDPEALRVIDNYLALTAANTPTVAECNVLADDLGVPRPRRTQ